MDKKPASERFSHLKETNKQVFTETLTLINGAFALVAALAWNEAIKAMIERYFKAGSGLYSRFIYAVVITVVFVLISSRLAKLTRRLNPENVANEN